MAATREAVPRRTEVDRATYAAPVTLICGVGLEEGESNIKLSSFESGACEDTSNESARVVWSSDDRSNPETWSSKARE
jgi:hypothetical protein